MKAAQYFAEGAGAIEVAHVLEVSRQSAHQWMQQWKQGGSDALRSRGKAGKKRKLTETQRADLVTALNQGAMAHGFNRGVYWSCPRVAKVIEQRTGLKFHRSHIRRLLQNLGIDLDELNRRLFEAVRADIRNWVRSQSPRERKLQPPKLS